METVMRGGLRARRRELGVEWAGWWEEPGKGRKGAPGSSPSKSLAGPRSPSIDMEISTQRDRGQQHLVKG